jgi:dihydrolipoamide dehydrogenase
MAEKGIVVIGGGPGGYVAAIRGAQLGAKVTLVEKGELGGVCLNRGCIPTKALLHGVELLELLQSAKEYGITTGEISVDFSKLNARKERAVKTLVSGVGGLMKSNGIEVLKGTARLLSPDKVEVTDAQGQKSTFQTGKIILATGSSSAEPPIPGADLPGVLDSDGVLRLTRIPASMVIIGAGPIGLEFGNIFAMLGTQVTILELLPQIMPTEDADVASTLEKVLRQRKIQIYTNCRVQDIAKQSEGMLKVRALTAEGEKTFDGENVLMAVGRSPNMAGLGLGEAGVSFTKKGIPVNEKMETNVPGIYAIGDVTGKWLLAHFASAQGRVAAENAAGQESKMDERVVPRCVYTSPEVACVGITERDVKAGNLDVKIGRFPFMANGKAAILGERNGFIKIIAGKQYDDILGVQIIGPHATDLIGEAVVAMRLESTAMDLADAIHPHPTLTEAMMETALDVNEMVVHMPPRKKT